MEKPYHRFSELFAQLGLASDASSIRAFIERHSQAMGSGTSTWKCISSSVDLQPSTWYCGR